jgi:hypothetical protein
MEERELDNTVKELGTILFIILIIGSLFEIGLLVFAYINVDEVECNLLWCSFSNSYSSSTYIEKSECYINDIKVNCSEIKDKHYCDMNGLCIMNGVCPGGSSDNRTVEDCINQVINSSNNGKENL